MTTDVEPLHSDDAPTDATPADGSPAGVEQGVIDVAAPAPNGGIPGGAVAVFRDPHDLVIDKNVRETFKLDDFPELADSIAEHGVLTPIIAYGYPDSPTVQVRDGQLRTLTAIELGIAQVPVWLIPPDDNVGDKDVEISRILEQITVNDRRIALTDGDRAAGIALALDLGASVTRVGKALQTKREQIKQAGKVGSSATARKVLDDGQLDIEQAAVLAEYENLGDTEAVNQLLETRRGQFTYQAHLIANDRADRRAYFEAALPWAEAGFEVLVDYPDDTGPESLLVHVNDLVDANGDQVDVDRLGAEHGWIVWIEPTSAPVIVEHDTGAVVDETTVDWDTENDPDREPAPGLRHAREVTRHSGWEADYFLPTDRLDDAGLRLRSHLPVDSDPLYDGADQETDDVAAREELAARRAEAEADAAVRREQERQATRRVRELNKQGVAAMEVRREFLTRLLARKTPPPEAAKFVAEALVAEPTLLDEYNAFETAAELLGGKGTWRRDLLQVVEAAKPARCQVIVLGLVLGAHEKRVGKDSWRHTDPSLGRYLRFLQQVGHELVPVELATIGELDSEHIDIDTPNTESEAA
ncbi:ParB/RepB/Spo0J family partition protein [Nocardia sp. NPDC050378]|uniref:ParB/RepB/Spo0J family partition protein n=1 Tax=Nocardia sp. NPDC050378 TaxID=3155400 RepID=UPI0033FA9C2C